MPEVYDIEQIIEAYDLLEYASRYTNLEQRRVGDEEYWGICPNPQHIEHTASFSVNTDKQVYNCLGCHCHGTVVGLTMMMERDEKGNRLNFYNALDKLAKEKDLSKTEITSIQLIGRKYKVKKAKEKCTGHTILPEDVMGDKTEEIIEWIEEGISTTIMDKFQVRRNKITKESIEFPIWDNDGNIINVCRRTIADNWKERKLTKYIYYNKLGCLDFLYGWYQQKEYIQMRKEIVLFEGVKSVFKAIDYGYNNVCSLLTSNISQEQIRMIIFSGIESVIFALDSDVNLKTITDMTTLLRHYCKVYWIDGSALLDSKQSPVDKGKDVFDILYSERKLIR